jgi:hypothetical protein
MRETAHNGHRILPVKKTLGLFFVTYGGCSVVVSTGCCELPSASSNLVNHPKNIHRSIVSVAKHDGLQNRKAGFESWWICHNN